MRLAVGGAEDARRLRSLAEHLDAGSGSRFASAVIEGDRSAATRSVLHAVGRLAALALGLGAVATAGAGWAWSHRAGGSAILLALAAALLLGSGAHALLRLARLAGLGFCGIWHLHLAARLLRLEVAGLVAGAALAAIGLAFG